MIRKEYVESAPAKRGFFNPVQEVYKNPLCETDKPIGIWLK